MNVGPGVWRVDELVPNGWTHTTDSAAVDQLLSGGTLTFDFGNFQLGTISGTKFNDLNHDGVKDPGEVGLVNWTLTLMNVATHSDQIRFRS